MPYSSTDSYSKDRRIVTRSMLWLNPTSAEYYPFAEDDRWRFVANCAIEFSKTAAATAEMMLEIEHPSHLIEVWHRYMTAAEFTTSSAALQSAEMVSRLNYYLSVSLNVIGNGIVVPPWHRLKFFGSGSAYLSGSMVIQEAADLSDLMGIIG